MFVSNLTTKIGVNTIGQHLNNMKKIIFILCIFITNILQTNAQYVTIPDPNFVQYLQSNYPSAMIGNQMDTSSLNIINDTILDVSNLGIQNLDGLQYFNSLQVFNCESNSLMTLPDLPPLLRALKCNFNQLVTLPTLPNTLEYLSCESNQLTSLPILPANLLELRCGMNNLSSLPSLPSALLNLKCNSNIITTLPALQNSLTELNCADNLINSLPTLPVYLQLLECSHNQLTSLPVLSNNLSFLSLNCSYNNITSIPVLPNSMHSLHFSYNMVSSWPVLPDTLISLMCGHNPLPNISFSLPVYLMHFECQSLQLTSLPALPPKLNYLDCDTNLLNTLPNFPNTIKTIFVSSNPSLTCLPQLPDSLENIKINGTSINCIPNKFNLLYPQWSTNNILNYPLCDINSGCPFYYNIAGNVHQDSSSNCLNDSLNPGNRLKNIKVKMLKNNIVQEQFYSNNNGEYSFDANVNDTLIISIDTSGLPFTISCPNSNSVSKILTALDSIDLNVNFGVKQNGVDAQIKYLNGRFRPVTNSVVEIKAGDVAKYHNFSSIPYGGTFITSFTGPVQYLGPASGALYPSIITGDSLIYYITDFTGLSDSAFNIILKTDTTATSNDFVCITSKIINVIGDINPTNDSLTMCFNVVNSFDPNDKTVYPSNAKAGDWLTYNIRFQNTGNDTAFLVVIKDTLSNNLDISSFDFLGASHHVITQIKDNIAIFTFPKINLIDSFHNEPASHGWIQFKIKLKDGLPQLTFTHNQAAIYFDYNPPILTNVATNTINPLAISNYNSFTPVIKIFPNPTHSFITITHNITGIVWAKLSSLDGQVVYDAILPQNHISVNGLAPGIYFLEVSNRTNQKVIEKVIIQ